MEESYDVIVLGGGAGGVPAAIRAAQLGGKVAIIESKDFGGLCMNRGCIPFSHMIVASNILGMAFPHPTLSESVAEAARDALGIPIYLP